MDSKLPDQTEVHFRSDTLAKKKIVRIQVALYSHGSAAVDVDEKHQPYKRGHIVPRVKTKNNENKLCLVKKNTHNRLKINRYCNCNCGTQYSVQQFW